MSLILLRITIAFYSVGLLHSFLTIITRKKTLFRVAIFGIGSGFVSHGLSIVYAWIEGQHPPITNIHEALSFFAFVIVLAFLISYARYRLDSLSVFVFPLVFILTLAANLISSSPQPRQEILKSLWFYIHIPTTFLGYAAFFVAFSAGVMYLIQEHELKRKRPQAFYYRLPSLEVCDDLGYRSLSIGFPLLTVGDRCRSAVGEQGVKPVLGLGSEDHLVADHMVDLRGAHSLSTVGRVARQTRCVHVHRWVRHRPVHFHRYPPPGQRPFIYTAMNIVLVGVSHKTAPVNIRERLHFPEPKLAQALELLRSRYELAGRHDSVDLQSG